MVYKGGPALQVWVVPDIVPSRKGYQASSWQKMPYYSAKTVNHLSQDYYGTDVPTLRDEVLRLKRSMSDLYAEQSRKDRDNRDLRRRYDSLKSSYRLVWKWYDWANDELRKEKDRNRRLWR
ncbi:hypothetical protein LTR17_025186 [Elasticomyces elasticus]|nr:hypothetical protein LTR17_025186 [Elasticomyces elasticus]